MTDPAASIPTSTVRRLPLAEALPLGLILVAFALLFYKPATLLVQDWWNDPEAGHGLLLAPAAIWLAWKKGLIADRAPSVVFGLLILVAAVILRLGSELAAELFTMRVSMMMALAGLVVYYLGLRQALAWWLPFMLLVLSVPLPELIGADTAVAWVRGVLLGIAVVLTVGTGIDYVLRAMRLRAAAPAVAPDPSDAT